MDFKHVRPEHVCHPLENVAGEYREALVKRGEELDAMQEKGEKSLKNVAEEDQALKLRAKIAKENIAMQKNDIIKAVEDVFNSRIDEINQLCAKFDQQLSGRRNQMESLLEKVKCTGNMCKNLLKKGSDGEIVESCKMVEERTKRVEEELQSVQQLQKPVDIEQSWFEVKEVNIGTVAILFGEGTIIIL